MFLCSMKPKYILIPSVIIIIIVFSVYTSFRTGPVKKQQVEEPSKVITVSDMLIEARGYAAQEKWEMAKLASNDIIIQYPNSKEALEAKEILTNSESQLVKIKAESEKIYKESEGQRLETIEKNPDYSITKHYYDRQLDRITFDVVLDSPAEEGFIRQISYEIKNSMKAASLTIIFYRLKGFEDAAWARVDYAPDYKLSLFGSAKLNNKDNISRQMAGIENAKLIGKWCDFTSNAERTLIIYSKAGKLYIRWVYTDQTYDDISLKKVGKKYIVIDIDGYDEWYIIESNGKLGTYSTKGKFSESVPID